MIELTIWEGAKAAGIVFWPILKGLAEDSIKDYGKDFFKDCLKKVIHLPEKDVQKEAYLSALKEFLQLFQQELKNADYQEGQIKQYLEPIQQFIEHPKVAAILGNAFEVNCKSLDILFLAKTWQEMNLPFLPEDFDWELIGKLYVRSVKRIITNSEKLRLIYDIQLQEKNAENLQELAGIPPDFDLGRYAEGLRETYSNLRLDSLEIDGPSYRKLELCKIFVPQNVKECQEFLPPELPKEYQQQSIKEIYPELSKQTKEELEQRHKHYINQQSQLIWEVVGEPTVNLSQSLIQHTVIFGDPGSGKSSLLQYLALTWAQRPINELSLYRLPLLIELRLYGRDKQSGNCKDLLSFIAQGNVTCWLNKRQLHEKLKTGSVIALFDGIDEIFDTALRDGVVTDIHRFSNDYPQVQIIATSRRLGYKGQELRNAGFRHFMLQDLEIEQIEDFIECWHELTFTDQADKVHKWERLIKAIQDSKSIRELAGNPLLLTMMAILNRHQELPRNRSDLYNKASEVLLHQWDMEVKLLENPKLKDWKIEIALIDKQKMLRKVAYFMQSNKKDTSGNLISKSDLENILTKSLREIIERGEPRMIARVMIEELQTRNFILCFLGADFYGFVHRTFLEYFCAWEFVWQFKEDQTLTINGLINKVLGAHWQDESWHEVLRLICGMIEPKFVAKIIDFLLAQKIDRSKFLDKYNIKKEVLGNLILAANCFVEVRNRNLITETSEKLLKILKSEIEQQPNEQDTHWYHNDLTYRLVSLIATNWKEDLDTLPWLKDRALQDKNKSSDVQKAAINSIARFWKEDPDTVFWLKDRALQDGDWVVRQAAINSIARFWKEDPDTVSWLKDRTLQDGDYPVRETAMLMITEGWKEDPDTLPWLTNFALHDENQWVRQAAVKIIARNWQEDPDTLSWLKDRALQDKNEYIRRASVSSIIQYWKKSPDILPWLKDYILNNKNWEFRQAVVKVIAEDWKEDPDTLPWLKDRALQDENADVRYIVVDVIVEGWKKAPDTLPWLKDRALQDEDFIVRQAAVNAIAQNWKKDPDTLPWLKNRALQDENYHVREAAVNAIIQNSQKDPELFEFLENIALNDPFKRESDFETNLRQTALEALLENFSNNPKTLEILNQVALNDSDEQLREFAVQKLQDLKNVNP